MTSKRDKLKSSLTDDNLKNEAKKAKEVILEYLKKHPEEKEIIFNQIQQLDPKNPREKAADRGYRNTPEDTEILDFLKQKLGVTADLKAVQLRKIADEVRMTLHVFPPGINLKDLLEWFRVHRDKIQDLDLSRIQL